jgi:hypothetical protein
MASGLSSACIFFCASTSFNAPRQVVSALPACSFTPTEVLNARQCPQIVSAFRLVEAQNQSASIRKPLAIEYKYFIQGVLSEKVNPLAFEYIITLSTLGLCVYQCYGRCGVERAVVEKPVRPFSLSNP